MAKRKINSAVGSDFHDHLEEELKNADAAAAYLNAAMEENDPDYLNIALGHVVRAHGFTNISRESGIGRETLYDMLSEDGNPGMDKIHDILEACGLSVKVIPHEKESEIMSLPKVVTSGARPEIVSQLWKYIKANGLTDKFQPAPEEKALQRLARDMHPTARKRSTTRVGSHAKRRK